MGTKGRMGVTILLVLALALASLAVRPLAAEEVGRYQALRMKENVAVFIDTKEGHVWKMMLDPADPGTQYCGKLSPGEYVGARGVSTPPFPGNMDEYLEWREEQEQKMKGK